MDEVHEQKELFNPKYTGEMMPKCVSLNFGAEYEAWEYNNL